MLEGGLYKESTFWLGSLELWAYKGEEELKGHITMSKKYAQHEN